MKGREYFGKLSAVRPYRWPLIDRIEINYVADPNSGCWLWIGAWNSTKYGIIQVGGKNRLAHRVVYQSLVGEIPPGLHLDHLCRTPCCVNPNHLEPVTTQVNTARGAASGTFGRGNRNKTHCKNGHPLSEENIKIYAGKVGPKRKCLTCQTQRIARLYPKASIAQNGEKA